MTICIKLFLFMLATLFHRFVALFNPSISSSVPVSAPESAGKYAESEVRKVLNDFTRHIGNATVIHNALFVLHRGCDNEFSVETDHILITTKNIYLFETKFKSGTVYAPPNKPYWKAFKNGDCVRFRNGLIQVLNSMKVLQRFLPIPITMIPLVVIVGPKLKIHGNNNQVLPLSELRDFIELSESATDSARINPRDVFKRLSSSISMSSDDVERHHQRAAKSKIVAGEKLAKHLHLKEQLPLN